MKKKLTVIGKGTVGALTVAHFLNYTDWNIDWVFDEDIPTTSVGEASNLKLPRELKNSLNFQHHDLLEIKGTVKQGIHKKYWGKGSDYLHPFPIDTSAIHFNAKDLHNKIFKMVEKNPKLKIINKHIDDPEKLDSDFVMVCSGSPKELNDDFVVLNKIPVNAVYVTQCEWDYPRFTYSLTNAMKHGWVFGIPLQNRISIGYLYNDKLNTLDEIKKDVQNVFKEYDLKPSSKTNDLTFNSFYRKNNFSKKVVYNGNASFFLEPLEATSTGFSADINRWAWDLWNGNLNEQQVQNLYESELNNIENMILLHYMSGSIYNTKFWKTAKKDATTKIKEEFSKKTTWSNFVLDSVNEYHQEGELGTWGSYNYQLNIKNLNLDKKLKSL
jgi:hypothetical protein